MKTSRLAGAVVLGAVVASSGLLVGVPGAAAAPVGCTSDFYSATNSASITKRDPSGVTSVIGTGALQVLTLALNPDDGHLYALSAVNAVGNHVYRVEDDGTSTDLGAVAGLPANTTFPGAAFASDGTLRVLPNWRVDLAAMTATQLGGTATGDFAHLDGYLYAGAPGARLLRIDPATGASTTLTVPGLGTFGAAWSTAGHLYVSQTLGIFEVLGYDTASPTLHAVGTAIGSGDGASCMTAESPFLGAVDDDYTAIPLTTAGGSTATVFSNDLTGSSAVSAANVTTTLESDGGLVGAAIAPDGILTVPASPAGTYSLVYAVCLTADPLVCDTATVGVLIQAAALPAEPTLPASGTDTSGYLLAGLTAIVLGALALIRSRRRTA